MLPETPDLWVLVCAPYSRYDETLALFESLGTPHGKRVVVTTMPDPIFSFDGHLVHFDSEEINISKWWTLGLDYIARQYKDQPDAKWDVLLAESDVFISGEDVDTIRRVMREEDCILAGADWLGKTDDGLHHVRRDNSPWKASGRIPGFAFVVAGEVGIRHDPDFRWWLADDDFEWNSRVSGGSVLVAGTTLTHYGTQGELTGSRLTAWLEDQAKFRAKWGALPAELGEN